MPAHNYLIPPADRWAIAAYIRTLQLSQYTSRQQLSPVDIERLDQATKTNPSRLSRRESTSVRRTKGDHVGPPH